MTVTMKQVLAEIDREEPIYAAFAKLGPGALPHLQMIIEADDPLKAAKAAYAASLIGGNAAVIALRVAAEHHDPQVRIAVAHGLQNMAQAAPSELVMKSLNDADEGVRKLALSTARALKRADFAPRVAEIEASDPALHLRSAGARPPAAKPPAAKTAAKTAARKKAPK
jgi:HEAT repeat protein